MDPSNGIPAVKCPHLLPRQEGQDVPGPLLEQQQVQHQGECLLQVILHRPLEMEELHLQRGRGDLSYFDVQPGS